MTKGTRTYIANSTGLGIHGAIKQKRARGARNSNAKRAFTNLRRVGFPISQCKENMVMPTSSQSIRIAKMTLEIELIGTRLT